MSMNYKDVLKKVGWPEDIVVIDFETYWDQEYSLSKQEWPTVRYVTSDKFEATGLGIYFKDGVHFYPPDEIRGALERHTGHYPLMEYASASHQHLDPNLGNCVVVMQNAFFDALILDHHYGIRPKYILDTKQIASFLEARKSHKLIDMAEEYGLKPKGDIKWSKGLHWDDMTEDQRNELGAYCRDDIDITTQLFQKMLPLVTNPELELPLMNHTTQLFLQKNFKFDFMLAMELKGKMEKQADKIAKELGYTQKVLRGNKTFFVLMQEALPPGERVPMKQGKKKMIPQFAKDDEGMKALLNHSDDKVRKLAEARQAVKSWPLHVKRVHNMIQQAKASDGYFRVPLKYAGAHTIRWSGCEGVNCQNFGTKADPLINQVRNLLMAPDGKVLVTGDSGAIEARGLAWIAGQTDLIEAFEQGRDVYSEFASMLLGRPVRKPKAYDPEPVAKILKTGRDYGKAYILGCIAEGSRVLTNNGWKKIEAVELSDKLWDGTNWVAHRGVVKKGKKQCINVQGVWLTPEHEILLKGGWTTAHELYIHNQEWGNYTATLRSQKLFTGNAAGLSPSNAVVSVVKLLLRHETIWSEENLHAVMSVLKKHPGKLRAIKHLCHDHINHDFLIEFVRSLVDVRRNPTSVTASEGLGFFLDGLAIECCFLNIWRRYQDGIIRILTSTGSTMILGTNRAICDSPQGAKTLETVDILHAGKNKRFQVEGLICSNSGYGMGAARMLVEMRKIPAFAEKIKRGEIDISTCKRDIKFYRRTYSMIPKFWGDVEKAFKVVTKYSDQVRTVGPLVFYSKNSMVFLRLPSGRELRYPHCSILRADSSIKWHYGHLWGGSITENIVQSMCRDLLGFWILECEKAGLPIVHHLHDELSSMVPKETGEEALSQVLGIMLTKPEWAKDFPLAAEGGLHDYYTK